MSGKNMTNKTTKKIPITEKSRQNYQTHQTVEESADSIQNMGLYSPSLTIRSAATFDMDKRGKCSACDEDSEPDRSSPLWKISPPISNAGENECVEETVDEEEEKSNIWEELMQEYENERKELLRLNLEAKPYEPDLPVGRKLTAVQYLEKYVFPTLFPALEDTLHMAKTEECLQIQKAIFSGLDYMSELLWNRNPMHPRRRKRGHTNIFDIPFVKIWMYYHPRPIYPLSWVWTKEEAITVIQTYIRRYFVCREPKCFEMRRFWQTFREEKTEEQRIRQLEHKAELHEIVTEILCEIIAIAVLDAERKTHGCFCISKPCHCKCKCFKWCKCCTCYKEEKSISVQFYSPLSSSLGSDIQLSYT